MVSPPAKIYMGKDKHESEWMIDPVCTVPCTRQLTLHPPAMPDEDLIKYGIEEDVWCAAYAVRVATKETFL